MLRKHKTDLTNSYRLDDGAVYLYDAFVLATVDRLLPVLLAELDDYSSPSLEINLDELERLDSAGVAALHLIQSRMQARGVEVRLTGGSDGIRNVLHTFQIKERKTDQPTEPPVWMERLGGFVNEFFTVKAKNFFLLISDVFYWSFNDFFRKKTFRKGDFVNQAILIGVNAVFIVGAMAFLIGLVLALQSAAQLRQFGANRFIVDLVVVAMMREMGPLVTAIIVAGRSSSAIASEIATMKITEELDALTTMAFDPIRFVVVPKLYAGLVTMPFLTIIADVLGITGGMVIAFTHLDIQPIIFLNRMQEVLYFRDIITGIVKSLVFIGIIVLTGTYYGFRAERGANEVGQVTTSAVVAAIALVIVADSVLGLIFY